MIGKPSASTVASPGFALLIGVETYTNLPQDKQLFGGRNDTIAFWMVCRRLGYLPENIRVLTSPRLTRDDLISAVRSVFPYTDPQKIEADVDTWFKNPDMFQEATEQTIREGVQWLAAHLPVPSKSGNGRGESLPGILTYSGHGAQQKDVLFLCPSDVTPDLEHSIPFPELQRMIRGVDKNLTVFLDCCYAAAASTDLELLAPTLTQMGTPALSDKAVRQFAERMFCASDVNEICYQARLGSDWHGAFTWAVTTVLSQWKMQQDGAFRISGISHQELLIRTRMLLEALSFPQHPVLQDVIGTLPLFHVGLRASPGETSDDPTAKRPGGQLDPSVHFSFTIYSLIFNGTTVAYAVVPNGTQTSGDYTWTGGIEYWYINQAFDTSTSGTWKLTVSGQNDTSGVDQNPADYDQISSTTTWTQGTYQPNVAHLINNASTFDFGLTARATSSGKSFSCSITWYNSFNGNLSFGIRPSVPSETDTLPTTTQSYSNIYQATTSSFTFTPPT